MCVVNCYVPSFAQVGNLTANINMPFDVISFVYKFIGNLANHNFGDLLGALPMRMTRGAINGAATAGFLTTVDWLYTNPTPTRNGENAGNR
jgi:hypothetical protein